jgi:dihydropteroate synthase
MLWELPSRALSLERPFLFGIVNVTPDSFSDGGWLGDTDAAVEYAERLLDTGADGVDIGGQSTRPHNSGPVSVDEELSRVLPVISTLRLSRPSAVISIDTVKAEVAREALDGGADVVNDVSGFRLEPEMASVCAKARAGVVLMHSRGGVADMALYEQAQYGADPVGEMVRELGERYAAARAAGVSASRIVLDPGIGFAKRTDDSIAALRELPRFAAIGRPLLVGASRKRFVGDLSGVSEPSLRVNGSVGAHVAALARGARLFRVHDVRPHREALDVAWSIVGDTRSES